MKPKEKPIRAWHIGEHGEVFAGRCGPVAIRNYYRKLCGNLAEANEAIIICFEESPQSEMGIVRKWGNGDNGKNFRSSYRREAEKCVELPMQIATTYY